LYVDERGVVVDIHVAKQWGSRLLRLLVLLYIFAGVALRAAIVTGHHWVGVVSMVTSLAVLLGALIKLHMRLEALSFRDTVIGFLILLSVQVMFIAAVRMPHSVASSILVIAVIAGLPFISGASRLSAPKKAADSGDLTKINEPRDV
jgi:hypothetical protein